MGEYLSCLKKKTSFSGSLAEAFKTNFSSFFIKPGKIKCDKTIQGFGDGENEFHLHAGIHRLKKEVSLVTFTLYSLYLKPFQLSLYNDIEINMTIAFIVINNSYLLETCFVRHYAKHFYIQ